MIYLQYTWYLIRHKFWVCYYARRVGADFWLCLLHDLSKLSPTEFGPYARWFYGEHGVKCTGTSASCDVHSKLKDDFHTAWSHHKARNKHHWEYWCVDPRGGPIPMQERYWREMAADWMAAGKAITGKMDVLNWYSQNRERIQLHQTTRKNVERVIHWTG